MNNIFILKPGRPKTEQKEKSKKQKAKYKERQKQMQIAKKKGIKHIGS